MRRSHLIVLCELIAPVALVIAAFVYCGAYFPLDADRLGGPSDFGANSAIGWIVARTLAERGELALWNPYHYTGHQFLGTPYVSLFNPLAVLPLVLFGPVNGAKVATVLAVALAGVGQYWLSRVLGHGGVVAFVAGVVGLAAGSLVRPTGERHGLRAGDAARLDGADARQFLARSARGAARPDRAGGGVLRPALPRGEPVLLARGVAPPRPVHARVLRQVGGFHRSPSRGVRPASARCGRGRSRARFLAGGGAGGADARPEPRRGQADRRAHPGVAVAAGDAVRLRCARQRFLRAAAVRRE